MSKSNNKNKSALSVKKGVEQVNKLDEKAMSKFSLSNKQNKSVEQYVKGVLSSDISILSQAITLVQ